MSKTLIAALQQIAAYPKNRGDELGYSACRRIAAQALSAHAADQAEPVTFDFWLENRAEVYLRVLGPGVRAFMREAYDAGRNSATAAQPAHDPSTHAVVPAITGRMIEELDSLIMDWTGASPGGTVIARWLRIVLDEPQLADTRVPDERVDKLQHFLGRALRIMDQWEEAYGQQQPEWLPPAGIVQLREQIDEWTKSLAALAQYGFKVKES